MSEHPLHYDEVRSLLEITSKISHEAGKLLVSASGETLSVRNDIGRDVKLEMDILSEQLIIEKLTTETPYGVIAEESGEAVGISTDSELRWIVDPLDGTLNYLRGIPMCCVSIALFNGLEPVLGVIHDFNRNQTYSGAPGIGAWLNDVPMNISSVPSTNKAVLCTGFPVGTDFSSSAVSEFVGFIQDFKKVRLLGSAALSLAFVASGKADAYCERDIKIWDIAAGTALVRAAGGHVEIISGPRSEIVTVFASNGLITRQ